jgi:transcriptional antiterminator RfaH
MNWHVLLTEPNRERTAARHLAMLGCVCYLPTFPKAHRQKAGNGRRWNVFRRPLFPGYLFTQTRDDLSHLARMVIGIRKGRPFLASDGKAKTVEDSKIEEIRKLEHELNTKRSRRMRFRIGDRVLIRDGAFVGLKANVYKLTDHERVTLLLDLLGRGTKVHLGVDQLDAAA